MAESFEQEITAHEEQLARASQTLDVDALNRLYADYILMTNVLGESCGKSVLMDEARRGAEMRQSVEATGKPIWKNARHTVHTCAEPPNQGSANLPNRSSSSKSKAAERKITAAAKPCAVRALRPSASTVVSGGRCASFLTNRTVVIPIHKTSGANIFPPPKKSQSRRLLV
jgi:hypothetical protein